MVAMYRRRALKIGSTFVEQGRLDDAKQIFNLTMSEISRAQTDRNLNLRSLIGSHLKAYKEVENVKSWPQLVDSRGKIIREKRQDASNDPSILLGDPIAPGKVRGTAKVLNTPYEKPLNSGEVLVARFTEPSWTPIFINASAVIMEIGGPLQHGAIIAREYGESSLKYCVLKCKRNKTIESYTRNSWIRSGIPCVSGLEDATTLIKDGDHLEVDGSTGTIRRLERRDVNANSRT
jgi:pyruvate,water dikinase